MPTAVFSFQVGDDGHVHVLHVFFAGSKTAADNLMRQHAEGCPSFGPAFRGNRTIEFAREVVDLPPADGDELEAWLDELLDGADEAEDDVIEMAPEDD